jgi:hypothetical protein
MDPWGFYPDDKLLRWFEEDLLRLLHEWPDAAETVMKKLEEMQRRGGMVGNAVMIGDIVVHLAKTPPVGPPHPVPALVLGFLVNQKERMLRPMLICRADEVSLENAGGTPSPAEGPREPIERRIRRRLEGRERRSH